jgi:hypothetical protein
LIDEIVSPWERGEPIVIDGRRWIPDATRITVYEGPPLTSNQRSMGQGWTKAIEFGENVTTTVLADGFAQSLGPSSAATGELDPEELDVELAHHQDWRPGNVAVAYGRDDTARQAMFAFLRALGLVPLEWGALISQRGRGRHRRSPS